MHKKALEISGLILFSILLLFFILYSPVIFQEGNPLPIAYGLGKITLTQAAFVKINTNTYLVRANDKDFTKLIEYLAKNNIFFVDRMGSGWFFKNKSGKRYTAESRMYSTHFEIFDFGKQ
ncbi:MAG TPA: hypothetical protein VLG12_08195 [Candidatus Saccharimonadales bacterium]|nr:hypothetical protein [Candidatus Saccharimonadales bacterium]